MTAGTLGLEIRVLDLRAESNDLLTGLARMLVDAYPIMHVDSTDAFERYVESLREGSAYAEARLVIAERDGALAGAMRLYDYEMNVRGLDALAGGLGSVAVSAPHKRRGVARAMVAWYIDDYRRRGAPFAALYPFRPDFYRALGFGYGTPMQRYRFAPATLQAGGARGTVRLLGEADLDALIACTERVRASTNGLIKRHSFPTRRALRNPELRFIGVEDGGMLRGSMQTRAIACDAQRNRDELEVRDLLCEDEAYTAALLAYLHAQRDQFVRVTIESQDAAFYLAAPNDPRDGSDVSVAPPAGHRVAETGLGIMYRILDVEGAFAHLPAFAAALVLRLVVDDSFVPGTGGTWTFRFGPHGAPLRDDGAQPDATLTIGIHDLSSVVMGSLRLRDVVRHRLAALEPRERLETVDAAFAVAQPPVCATRF
jgi:predicted N-acetyltransferase YhbS